MFVLRPTKSDCDFNELLLGAFFNLLSEVSPKEEHKDSDKHKEYKNVGAITIFSPLVNSFVGEEYGNCQV
jgi:hypothetical protein